MSIEEKVAKKREYAQRPEVKERRRQRDAKNLKRLAKYAREWARRNPEKIRARMEKAKAKEARKRWNVANRKKIYRATKKYVSLNQQKRKAHIEVRYALKYARLIRPNVCSECGKICIPDAHHEDYSKPLEVKWVCRRCHMDIHVLERKRKLPRGEELATGEASARSNDAPAERRLPKAQAPEEHPRGTPAPVDMRKFLP